MAQGSGFTARGKRPLGIPLTSVPDAPNIRSGAAGARRAAGTFSGLAGQLNLLGTELVEQDNKRQAEEAKQAGEQAGIEAARTGQAFEERDTGFFGRRSDDAFNTAAAEGYAQGLDVQINARRQELELEHEADPDGFMKAWDEYAAEVAQRAPPDMRQAVALELDAHANDADGRLAGQKRERVMDEASLNVRMNADRLFVQATNEARAAGDPTAAAESLGDLTTSVESAIATGLLTPAAGAAILTGARDATWSNAYLGAFERNPSRAALQAFLEADTPELTPRQKDQLAGEMQATISRQESEANAALKRLAGEAETVVKALDAGVQVPGPVLDELQARVIGTELETPVQLAIEVAGQTQSAAQMTPEEQAQIITDLDAQIEDLQASKPATAEETGLVTAQVLMLAKYRENVAGILTETAEAVGEGRTVDLAQARGIVELAPIEFSSDQALAASLDARVAAAEVAEEHFGAQPGSILTAAEGADLAARLQIGAAETGDQVAVLGRMADRLGPDRLASVLDDVAAKEPEIAFAAGLPQDVMGKALAGRAQIAATPALAPGKNEIDTRASIDSAYGGVLDLIPQTRGAAVETARWLYAEESARLGDLSGDLDPERWERALRTAAGNPLEWENDEGIGVSRVVPPDPSMTGDQFALLMDSLSDQDLAAGGQRPLTRLGVPAGARHIRRMARLQSVGNGLYAVTIEGAPLIDQNGQTYELDLRAVIRDRQARGVPVIPARPAPTTPSSIALDQIRLEREAQERAQGVADIADMTLEQLQELDTSVLTQEQALAVAARAAELGGG